MDIFSANAPARKRILLLSGTCEGPRLAQALAEAGFSVRATVTRDEACANLFGKKHPLVTVERRGFTAETLTAFLRDDGADLVLDATHPFAVRITLLAHEVCARLGVPYVRYERPDWPAPPGTHVVDGFTHAASVLPELGRRVMLTIGAKQLKHFAHLHDRLSLVARILPSPVSLEQAFAAGFTKDKVLCLRPPFSTEFNQAMFREYGVGTLVTKASGPEGGVVEKVTAARGLGMAVVLIRRPTLPDMATESDLGGVLALCKAMVLHQPFSN